jgi:hypothetical protein
VKGKGKGMGMVMSAFNYSQITLGAKSSQVFIVSKVVEQRIQEAIIELL